MNGLFLLLVLLVTLVLVTLHDNHLLSLSYLLFPLLLCVSRYHSRLLVKRAFAILALLLILVLGMTFPADVEAIEEGFILIPLLYILIFPHSLWPIPVSILLLLTYFPSLDNHELVDFIEDCIEVVVIATFATVMSFYQYKTKMQSQFFKEQSLTDDLTLIPNRKAFHQQLQENFQRWQGNSHYDFALVLIDLDDFKRINDQFGHEIGDQLLAEVAYRLMKCSCNGASVYRLGGDEFCMLVSGGEGQAALQSQIAAVISKMFDESTSQYRLKRCVQTITPTVGISLFPYDAKEVDVLLRNADLAMLDCKTHGKNNYAYFERGMFETAIRQFEIEDQLKRAIDDEQLYLVYQPKVCLTTGKVKGVEALIRWQHPELGSVSPAEFIPIAESSGMIVPIGLWVLTKACQQLAKWQETEGEFYVSVNVSAIQIQQSGLVNAVTEVIDRTGVDANWLEFELTETAIMESPELYVEKFQAFKKLGIRIAIDDFGVAYSSLAYLTKLPVDTLKIDKSFVDNCDSNHNDRMIVRTIVQLGQNLGLTTVAEGVEFETQREILEEEGVDRFQGYLYSKPVPDTELLTLVRL